MMGKKVIPFQTINFVVGSEQRAHSDSIHMTTYQPPGYLIASLGGFGRNPRGEQDHCFIIQKAIALPLHYHAGLRFGQFQILSSENESNKRYEDKIEELVKESMAGEKEHFHAKKGDILIWHANLYAWWRGHYHQPKARPAGAWFRSLFL